MEEKEKDSCRCVVCGTKLKLNVFSLRSHIRKHSKSYTSEDVDLYVFMSMSEDPKRAIREFPSSDLPTYLLKNALVAEFRNSTLKYRNGLDKIKKHGKLKIKKKTVWKPRVRRKNPTPVKKDFTENVKSRFKWIMNDKDIPEEHREEIGLSLGMKYLLRKSRKTLDQLQKEFKKENDLQSEQNEVQ